MESTVDSFLSRLLMYVPEFVVSVYESMAYVPSNSFVAKLVLLNREFQMVLMLAGLMPWHEIPEIISSGAQTTALRWSNRSTTMQES
ncbi:MAG: hypothetical protein IPG07_20540 [Crocinitomicaceae bacterium]|nr:hypothetical protein [Crocinitomicaceae bacterium]